MNTNTIIPTKKFFTLDTNIPLHDPNCIRSFAEHNVDIPDTVIKELDNHKKGNEIKNYNVRLFHRELKSLRETKTVREFKKKRGRNTVIIKKRVPELSNGGTNIGPGLGKIEIIRFTKAMSNWMKTNFLEDTPDNRILATVVAREEEVFAKYGSDCKVVLVTKDTNLQLKADLFGIDVEDYENDKIANIDMLYTGKGTLSNPELYRLIDGLNSKKKVPIFGKEYGKYIPKEEICPNKFMTISTGTKSVLAYVDPNEEFFYKVETPTMSGITPLNDEQMFSSYALLDPYIKLVLLLGKAGTGKTLLAMAAALEQLRSKRYDRVFIASAMVPLSDKSVGALPGDMEAKLSPYMQGLFDNLAFIRSQLKGSWDNEGVIQEKVKTPTKKRRNNGNAAQTKQKIAPVIEGETKDYIARQQELGNLVIQPLTSIRGRSLNNVIFIIDEAQNLTPHEVKTIITRAGKNAKIIFCGDVKQIDTPYLDERSNGLTHAIDKMHGKMIVANVTLTKGERSELAELAADLL